jgi:hypothetical protein
MEKITPRLWFPRSLLRPAAAARAVPRSSDFVSWTAMNCPAGKFSRLPM